jgi:bacterioferritin-associated ferredoxin
MYICICNAVTERQVCAAVDAGATTLRDLQAELGVATQCGCCTARVMMCLPKTAAAVADAEVTEVSLTRRSAPRPQRDGQDNPAYCPCSLTTSATA